MRVTVPAYAKLNLSLVILGRRPDGYHELRTVFQTISLRDTLVIDYAPAPRTSIEIDCEAAIADNLAVRAARLLLGRMRTSARVRLTLSKRIPMGAGLGGGSSDAAAVLLALPVLARRRVEPAALAEMAAELGSDVPFFLLGGAAMGFGRGQELYPVPTPRTAPVLLVCPPVSVSTADAYRDLGRPPLEQLTLRDCSNRMKKFQSLVSGVVCSEAQADWTVFCENDFEAAVFRRHPPLKSLQKKLLRAGAGFVGMTGSGSALFAVFPERPSLERARIAVAGDVVLAEPVRFVSRGQYRAAWRRSLGPIVGDQWPPQSP